MSHHNLSRHITSHLVMSCHITSRRSDVFWVRMNNVATLLDIYEQRRDVGHERRDIARFSNERKNVKIPSLGLLITSKLFLLHINHPRSSHDHIHEEQHWIYTFQTENLIFEAFENMGTKNRKLSTINRF